MVWFGWLSIRNLNSSSGKLDYAKRFFLTLTRLVGLPPQAPVAQKSADQSRLIVFLLSLVIRISDETADSKQYVDLKTNLKMKAGKAIVL